MKVLALALIVGLAGVATPVAVNAQQLGAQSSGGFTFTVEIPPFAAALAASREGAVGLWTMEDAHGGLVRLRFEAQRVISLFGQALDASGAPLGGARVEAGSDFAVADDRGYFTITAPLAASITVKTPSGEPCIARPISSLVNTRDPSLIYRFGKIRCAADGGLREKAAPAIPEPSRPTPASFSPSIKPAATATPALQPVASNIATPAGRQGQLWNSAADKLATARANIEMLGGPRA